MGALTEAPAKANYNGPSSPLITVVAVSHSRPATQMMHSQPTRTAIVRSPSLTPLVLTPEGGIEGHKSAVHDAQVYAFFSKHYDYWASSLKIERSNWDWAFWGENLTLNVPDGVDETNINLGDRWVFTPSSQRYGSQNSKYGDKKQDNVREKAQPGVILEVCGGRNPCSRLSWRCGQPGSWLAEVAKSGFCGVYLKVVHGGSIAPGDTARVIPTSDEDTMPAASIAQCAYAPLTDPATRTLAQRILRVSGLQNMNRQVIARKLALIEDAEMTKKNRWSGWRSLKVSRIVEESAFVKSFYLTAADGKPLAAYVPGQFITVKLPSGQIRRWSISSWSPSSTTELPPLYRITVKKGMDASLYLHSNISTGDTLLARSPSGSFVPDWSREFPPRQIYVSAGIGMTPILSMLQAHLAHPTLSKIPAILLHVARNSEEDVPLFQSELARSSLLHVIRFYTAPIAGVDTQGQDYDCSGRPTLEFLSNLLRVPYHIDPLKITPIELPGIVSNAYICGTPGFTDTMRGYLELCKLPPQAIHSESFSSRVAIPLVEDTPSSLELYPEDVPEESTVRFGGKEAKWKKAEGLSILELIEREEKEDQPDSACRIGDCGTCEMKLLKGEARVSKQAGKEAQEASGKAGTMIRVCCSYPASKLVELEF